MKKKKKRYKTLRQISDQAYRMYDECVYTNPTRAHKILEIKFRYQERINNLPEQQRYLQRSYGKPDYKSNQIHEKRCNIKYPRMVYAGF